MARADTHRERDQTGPPSEHTFVVADLAGYTALTEAHGDEQAADAAAEFCAAVRRLLRAHGAEEVKTIGDAILMRVADAGQAVDLAERIVTGYGARHRTLGVRAGVHTGTAVRRGDDWFGSAVNLTARVADLAAAGEVLLTETTKRALDLTVVLQSRGPQSFKNVPRPLEVYALDINRLARVRDAQLQLLQPTGWADRPRPVAEVALDLAEYRRHRIGREMDVLPDVEPVDRLEDADAGDLHKIVERLAAPPVPRGERARQRQHQLRQFALRTRIAFEVIPAQELPLTMGATKVDVGALLHLGGLLPARSGADG